MSESAVERAELLLEAGRPEDAEREARASLLAEPGDGYAHGILARALVMRGRSEEAVAAAREALEDDPEDEGALFVLALALSLTGDLQGAESAIRTAIAIDPENGAFHQMLAEILMQNDRNAEAFGAASEARAFAPHDADAVAAYAHTLVLQGPIDDAEHAAREALAIDPENDRAHHVLGLVGLNCGDSRQALAGFREALRLDPTDESAREGVVLALKARHPVYARVLRFFLWQARLPKETRWALLIAPFVIGRVIQTVHNNAVFYPLAVVFIGLIVLTWAADPVMTLALLATREGRAVVSRESRMAASLFGGFITAAVVAAVVGSVTDPHLYIVTFGFVVFALAAGNVDSLPERRRKVVYAAATALALVAILETGIVAAGGGYHAQVVPAFVLILGAAASLWYVRLAS